MASQTDLDMGGSFRQFVRRYLGPSVGWVWTPEDNVVPITAAGTKTVLVGTTLVTVNVNGNVTVQLPSAKASANATAGALPGLSLALPITIVDIGGFVDGAAVLITILPFGAETIMGRASIQIATPYGAFTLLPNLTAGGWNQQ
jgi:hypothetical protein